MGYTQTEISGKKMNMSKSSKNSKGDNLTLAEQQVIVEKQSKELFCPLSIIKTLPGSVYWKNTEGVYLGCNDAMLKMAGTNEVIGKTDFDLPWKEQAPQIRKNDLDVIKRNTSVELEESSTLADGQQVVVLTRRTPLKDEQGNTVGILGISFDITERKKFEAALKELKDQTEATNVILLRAKEQAEFTLDNIVANMPGHVYWKDKEGIYLGCNNRQAQSLGLYYGFEVIGKTDFDLPWAKDVANTFKENDIRIMELGKTETIEENAQIDGEEAVVLSQKAPLRDKDGNVVGVLGISIDITERKRFEAALKDEKERAEAANRAKTDFLENMRHDLRTPLMGITGFAKIIRDEVSEPKTKAHVDNLTASSFALLDLLNEILETIKINSGEVPLLKKKFDLKKRLMNVINLNKARAAHKSINLVFDYDENIPMYLIGDSMRVHRIALELVTNAINFTGVGSVKLIVQLAKTSDRDCVVKLIVEDTGIGIEASQQQEVFTQFKRLTPSSKGTYKGAGLGLAMVKQLLNDIDGEVYVESQLGVGTKFTCLFSLKIPLVNDDFGCEEPTFTTPSRAEGMYTPEFDFEGNDSEASTSDNRVLVVEDQIMASIVVRNMLSSLNCQVDIAENGEQGVELAKNNHYELIFMDIGLPDIDGYEVTRRIRANEGKGAKTPIIALTAHVDDENSGHCIEAGMNAVTSKPLIQEKAESILDTFIPRRKKDTILHKVIKSAKEKNALPIKGKSIDAAAARKVLGNKEGIFQEALKLLKSSLLEEVVKLNTAHTKKDWAVIQSIVHKMRGGCSYCGAVRLQDVCGRLETSIKSDKTECYDELYGLVLNEIKAVQKCIDTKNY
jgi:two-component system aerobic respiration control sensor histidine kinase ArcB